MFNLDIPYKWKATLTLLAVCLAAVTGAFADDVFNMNDVSVFGTQVVEAVVAYIAVFKVKNRGQMTISSAKTVDGSEGF